MDQPSAKKRRKLAPKGAEPTTTQFALEPVSESGRRPSACRLWAGIDSGESPSQQQPPPQQQQPPQPPPQPHYQAPEVLHHPERHDFESFARHLQDAAMLIQRQTERPPYTSVSVLLLRWEEDASVETDLVALETVLRERYNFRTERWNIPTVPNPSVKLGFHMHSFLENARANHLLIIYYAGFGYVGPDNQLYWAW
jgi:hypothetical protein